MARNNPVAAAIEYVINTLIKININVVVARIYRIKYLTVEKIKV